jgi:hypothetical protein
MCDFHARLIAVAERLGAQEVRLEPPGASETNGRFRSHPHIAGLVGGTRFRFPVPLRPKDTPRRLLNYFTKLRRLLVELGACRRCVVTPGGDASPPAASTSHASASRDRALPPARCRLRRRT